MKNKKVVFLFVGFMCCFSVIFSAYSQQNITYAESDKTYDCGVIPPLPTYSLWLEPDENITVESADFVLDLDADYPVLNTEITVTASEDISLNCLIPFYGRPIDTTEDSATLTFNGTKITPTIKLAAPDPKLWRDTPYETIISSMSDYTLPDMETVCYKYNILSVPSEGLTFTVSQPVKIIEWFTHYKCVSGKDKPTQYTVFSDPSPFYSLNSDIIIAENDKTRFVRSEITYAQMFSEIMNLITQIYNDDEYSSEILKPYIENAFAYYFENCSVIELNKLIDAPTDYAFTYLSYTVDLPKGENKITATQPLNYSYDTSIDPKTQNFDLRLSSFNNPHFTFSTERTIVNKEESDEKIAFGVRNISAPKLQTRHIILIAVCAVVLLLFSAFILYKKVIKKQ